MKLTDISGLIENIGSKFQFQSILTALSSAVLWLVGGWDAVLSILGTVIICDYISGVLAAIKNKQLNSTIGWLGLLKKAATILIVVVAHLMDVALGNSDDIVRNITALFYISNELISIFENVGELGVPLPSILIEVCQKLKNSDKSDNE